MPSSAAREICLYVFIPWFGCAEFLAPFSQQSTINNQPFHKDLVTSGGPASVCANGYPNPENLSNPENPASNKIQRV